MSNDLILELVRVSAVMRLTGNPDAAKVIDQSIEAMRELTSVALDVVECYWEGGDEQSVAHEAKAVLKRMGFLK